MNLTNLVIRNVKPADKAYPQKDNSRLYLSINTNGTKQWLFRFYGEGG